MYTLGCIKKGINDYNTKAEDVVAEVEAWAAAHPRKTRKDIFLKQYPNARLDSQNTPDICPADAYGDTVCPTNKENPYTLCWDCRRKFWGQEVE